MASTITTADGVTLSVEFSPTTRPLETPVWVEVASLIREGSGLQIRRGRSSELDRFQAGKCSFTLDNRDLLFDPSNTSGTYYGQLLPMRRVRVRATYSAVTYDLFEGFILGWPQSYDLGDNDAVVQVEAVDAFEILQNTNAEDNFLILDDEVFGRLDFNRLGGTDVTITEETAGGQLATVLNIAGWPSGERDLDDGINLMEAGTLTGSVLGYCQNVEDSEDGFFFVAKNGDVTFLGRDARWLNSRLTTTQFTLADDGADMPYDGVSLRYDRDFIFNDVTRTGSGEPQRAADSGSMAEYGRRRDEKSGLVANDAGLKAVADYRVARFADPQVRPEPVSVPVRARPAQIPSVLGAELLDRVVLERRPMGGTVRTFTGLLQSIDLNISQVRFDATFTISPGDVDDTQYLVLDDATDGLLNTAILAY